MTVTRGPRTALYARVSKGDDQDPETQLFELREWATRLGLATTEFVDEVSSRDRRPQKEDLVRRVRVGEFDTVAVVRLDRWGRSMDELVLELDEFRRRKVSLVSLRDGLHFDDATGVLLAHILSAFANFERELIKERTLAGLKRATSQGKIGGRHPLDCGCGARPEGKPPHLGSVLPIRGDDGKRLVGWRRPDGRSVAVQTNPPRPDGGLPASEALPAEQTGV